MPSPTTVSHHNIYALEGLDFSGKTSVAQAVVNLLDDRNIPVVLLRDPGSTALGDAIRDLMLHTKVAMVPEAMCALSIAAARQCLDAAYRARDSGRIVILDRCYLSNVAYRYADGLSWSFVYGACKHFDLILPPWKLFVLEVSEEERCVRASKAPGRGVDRFEKRGADYFKRVAEGYRCAVHDFHCATPIDGNRSVHDVAADLLGRIAATMVGETAPS